MSSPELMELLRAELPVRLESYGLDGRTPGLVIVDEVNGFCTVGAGSMAPPAPDDAIARMVAETDRLARRFAERRQAILAFLDTHQSGRPEHPYPAHCVSGTGEEMLVPELAWLEDCPHATLVRKDCINGFVGAIEAAYHGKHGQHHNRLVDWINAHRLDSLVVTGICTDICVMDLVLTLLSARNHNMMPTLTDVVVYEPATATYDLPRSAAEEQGLPPTAAHGRPATHHMGLYFMAARGAILASSLE